MNIVNDLIHRHRHFPELAHRWVPTLAIILSMLLSLWAPRVLAQETQPADEIRESLRQEILQELRGTAELEALKEEIKREILRELRNEREISEQADHETRQKMEKDIREQIFLELDKGASVAHPQAVKLATDTHMGDAEGRVLRRGDGLAGCKVKLLKLGGRSARYQRHELGEEFITITNQEGNYHFAGIPVGDYKIKWELPGETGWIKRLRDTPDVEVVSGQTSTLKPIETARQLAPR